MIQKDDFSVDLIPVHDVLMTEPTTEQQVKTLNLKVNDIIVQHNALAQRANATAIEYNELIEDMKREALRKRAT